MPLFHIHGLVAALLASLSAGGSVVCTPKLLAERWFDWLEETRPTWYTAVPSMHQLILEEAEAFPERARRTGLRLIRSSSASLPPRIMARLEEVTRVPVLEAYGMTEAAHQMSSNPLPPGTRKPGSVGLPAGPQIAVMDEQGNLQPAGVDGDVVIRGVNVTSGYENNPQANQAAFCNGWFRTGDRGHFDSEGYLYLTGRTKEIINRGGEKIAPREIDEVLLEHPAVLQAVAFALPHPRLGEDVAAAVVLRPQTPASEAELRSFAFTRLAPTKMPSRILIVPEIPKGPTGKIQRVGMAGRLESHLHVEYAAPTHDVEERLSAIWGEILSLPQVGIHDNFFSLGGDSLLGMRVISCVNAAYSLNLVPTVLFSRPTVEQLALTVLAELLDEIGKSELAPSNAPNAMP